MMTTTAFISGPITPPADYFTTYYADAILNAIDSGHSFVVGPAPGVDTLALHFLIENNVPASKITVYLAEFQKNRAHDDTALKWFADLGGNIKVEGVKTGERDAAMTRDSDYDILRYMTAGEQRELYGDLYYQRVSNTEKNERRRQGLKIHDDYALPEQELTHPEHKIGQRKGWRAWLGKIYQRVSGAGK